VTAPTSPPAGGSTAQLPRLLALVPYLLARPGVRLAEVAADFGITEDRLRKDLNLLWVCGLPGHGPGDLIDVEFEGETVTLLEPAGVTRPLRLTVDEALALIVALRALAETPGPGPARRRGPGAGQGRAGGRRRRRAGAAGRDRGRGRAAGPAGGPHGARAVPAAAPVLLRAGRDETTERDVDPMRLLLVEGRSYLEAWCRRAEGVRLFRLDRVHEVALLDLPSEPPADVQPRDLARGCSGRDRTTCSSPWRCAPVRPGWPTTTPASR
jgi:proteasome accessory factor C